MTENVKLSEARIRSAFRRLWSASVLLIGFVIGLAIVRLLYWPPQSRTAEPLEWSGFAAFIVVLMLAYLAFCVWHYILVPVIVLFRDVRNATKRCAAIGVIIRDALKLGLMMSLPMAFGIAFDLPQPWSFVQLVLIWGAYTLLIRFRGPTISAAFELANA